MATMPGGDEARGPAGGSFNPYLQAQGNTAGTGTPSAPATPPTFHSFGDLVGHGRPLKPEDAAKLHAISMVLSNMGQAAGAQGSGGMTPSAPMSQDQALSARLHALGGGPTGAGLAPGESYQQHMARIAALQHNDIGGYDAATASLVPSFRADIAGTGMGGLPGGGGGQGWLNTMAARQQPSMLGVGGTAGAAVPALGAAWNALSGFAPRPRVSTPENLNALPRPVMMNPYLAAMSAYRG